MTDKNYDREREAAVSAVAEAGRFCRAVRDQMVAGDALVKADRSPVTVADFGSQALICRQIADVFPGDPIVAEEDSGDLGKPQNAPVLASVLNFVRQSGVAADAASLMEWIDRGRGKVSRRFWTIDPIDGTKGFLRNDQYAVALALIEDGEVRVGALACPALSFGPAKEEVGALFVAVRGQGSVAVGLGGEGVVGPESPLSVNAAPDADALRFVESVEADHGDQRLQAAVARAVNITAPSLRMDSQAKYAAVARGDAVLYLRLPAGGPGRYDEKIWDHAAGSLIVEEAGGTVTDMLGRRLHWGPGPRMQQNRGVVVTNGVLHDVVIDAIGRTAGGSAGRPAEATRTVSTHSPERMTS